MEPTTIIILALLIIGLCVLWILYRKIFVEYDRCLLIRLGDIDDALNYAAVPLIVGRIPFVDIDNAVESDLDPRAVVGFVIDQPLWLDNVSGLGVDSEDFNAPGYYAACLINWESIDEVSKYGDLGFGIRRISNGSESIAKGTRELCFLGFGTNCTPDKLGIAPCFIHIQRGILAPFRYHPYAKFGFTTPMRFRRWSPLTYLYIKLFKRKELKKSVY